MVGVAMVASRPLIKGRRWRQQPSINNCLMMQMLRHDNCKSLQVSSGPDQGRLLI